MGTNLSKYGNELESLKLHLKCSIHINNRIERQEEAINIMLVPRITSTSHSPHVANASGSQLHGKVVASSLDLQIIVVRQSM